MQKQIKYVFLALMLAICASLSLASVDKTISKDYPLTKLSEHVYVIYGPNEEVSKENQAFRNNPAIILTSEGAVVVDPGSSVYTGEMVVKKVKQLTSKPVIAVFNSHVHGDHWLGNHGIRNHFPKADIYGHQSMIDDIGAGAGEMWIKAINRRSEGAIEGTKIVAPDKPISFGQSMKFGDITIHVYHTGKSHSDSDIMLQVAQDNVLLMGDVLRAHNLSPFMSSFSGNLNALEQAEKLNAKIYLPGHGVAGDKALLDQHRQFLVTLKSQVKKYYDDGMSDFEMKPVVINSLEKYKTWSGFDETIGRLINLAYIEVEAESF